MSELSELTNEPKIAAVESNGKVNGSEYVSRWTNYGKDRLYINNWTRCDLWVDLQNGSVETDNAGTPFSLEINEDERTITVKKSAGTEKEIVIDLDSSFEVKADEGSEGEEANGTQIDKREGGEHEVELLDDDEFADPSVGEAGKCLHANCDAIADVAVKCDTGQIKHYCDDHHDGRRAGHARVDESKRLRSSKDNAGDEYRDSDDAGSEDQDHAEPTPEHVAEVGYNKAAGQAQQIEAQRLFAGEGESE